jgi:PKD repeat protein
MMKKLFILTTILSLFKIAKAQVEPVKADFDYTPKFITTNDLNITFTDKSTGPIKDWYWDFGDGVYVTTQNPTHKYSQSGVYAVALTVLDNNGNSNQKIVAVDARIFIPDFSVSSPSGKFITNEEIQFMDKTPNTPESWLWDFGDGTTSSDQNPKHIYEKIGTYSVKLTVTKLNTMKSIDKPVIINISKLRFAGQVVDAATKRPLKNITVNLYKSEDEYNIYACTGLWRSYFHPFTTLVTDDNGNYSSTMDWDGKENLVVFIKDDNSNIYIPYLGKYTGYREDLTMKVYLNGTDKFQITSKYIKPNTYNIIYSVTWSYSDNKVGKLPSKGCGDGGFLYIPELYSSYREVWRTTTKINADGDNVYGSVNFPINCPTYDVDYFISVNMSYRFDNDPAKFELTSKTCILKGRSSNNIIPDFNFIENSDFIMLGEPTKIIDISSPLTKINKIEISWGDGTISKYEKGTTYPISRSFEHIYNSPGEYSILLKTYDATGWNASTSAKCRVISCSSGSFEYINANSKLIFVSDNITKENFNYDDMLSSKYPGEYKPVSECIMEACNQIKIEPNSVLGQTLNVPLTLRIITPGSSIKSAKVNSNDGTDIQEETASTTTEPEDVSIYPNPARLFFSIITSGKSTLKSYQLFNNVGNCIKTGNCGGSETLVDISSFSPGIYLIKVFTMDNSYNSKLIIE